jgi:hypothetical protein
LAEAAISLQTDPALPDAVRRLTGQLAADWPDDPSRYARAAWGLARRSDLRPAEVAQALGWADLAYARAPGRADFAVVRAAALLRAGRWAECRDVLAAANGGDNWSTVPKLAFRVLAETRLGNAAAADAARAELRRAARGRLSADLAALCREAGVAAGPPE